MQPKVCDASKPKSRSPRERADSPSASHKPEATVLVRLQLGVMGASWESTQVRRDSQTEGHKRRTSVQSRTSEENARAHRAETGEDGLWRKVTQHLHSRFDGEENGERKRVGQEEVQYRRKGDTVNATISPEPPLWVRGRDSYRPTRESHVAGPGRRSLVQGGGGRAHVSRAKRRSGRR